MTATQQRDICFELILRPVQLVFLVTVIILGIKRRSLVLFNESLAIPQVTNHCRYLQNNVEHYCQLLFLHLCLFLQIRKFSSCVQKRQVSTVLPCTEFRTKLNLPETETVSFFR